MAGLLSSLLHLLPSLGNVREIALENLASQATPAELSLTVHHRGDSYDRRLDVPWFGLYSSGSWPDGLQGAYERASLWCPRRSDCGHFGLTAWQLFVGIDGIVAYGLLGRLVLSVVGAIILLWLIRLIKRA